MPLIIRAATIKDAPALMPLLAELGYWQEQPTFNAHLKRFLQQKDAGVAIAILATKVVGFIAWSKSYLLIEPKSRIHIEALVVAKEHKRKGIGKALLNHLEAIAQIYSPVIIDLTSGLKRKLDGTHAFYHSCGYINQGDKEKVYLRKELMNL